MGASSRRKLPRELSLAALLAMVTCASLVPVVLLGAYGIKVIVEGERVQETRRVIEVARAVSQSVDRELDAYREKANVLAASSTLQSGDIEGFGRLARESGVKMDSRFVLIDRSFRELVNTRAPNDSNLPSSAHIDAVRRVFETGKPLVSDLQTGAYSNELTFSVMTPVFIGTEVRYALALSPDHNAIQTILMQNYLPDGWLSTIIDSKYRILARSSRFDEYFGRGASDGIRLLMTEPTGTIDTVDLEGRHAVTAYITSSISGWRTVVWVPKSVIAAPSQRLRWLTSGLALLTLLISLGGAALVGYLIRRPAAQIVESAHKLSAGEPVVYHPSVMREANMVHRALAETAEVIAKREHELRLSDEHTQFIMRELSHRSKNLLAIIQSMARQTSRNSCNMAEFERRFEERISGLARSHDLLIGRNWQGAMLADLVDSQLAPFIDSTKDRVTFAGPDILVRPAAAHTLGMVLHELATNASKYGALSSPAGRIEIDWRLEHPIVDAPHFHMRWRESGGPPVTAPQRHGFGHVVIERMTASAFGGAAHVSWAKSGFMWELDAPAAAIDGTMAVESRPADGDAKVSPEAPLQAKVSTHA